MRRFKMFIKKEPLALPVVLIIIGLLAGYIAARIFYSWFPEAVILWNEEYVKVISAAELGGLSLFRFIAANSIKEVLLYFMMCLTILGVPYYAYIIIKQSLQVSFLISTLIHVYQSKGLFMAFCNYFPQMLLYLPASYLCVKYGWSLYMDVQSGRVKPSFRKSTLIKKYGRSFLLVLALLTAGAALEAFVGKIIWQWAAGAV